jgi:Gpi18-like mannosyltransferase
VALDLPAIVAGRSPIELLTIYDLGRQARNVPGLGVRLPSLYAFLPAGGPVGTIRTLGYILTAAIVLGICWVLIARAAAMTRDRVVLAATLFALLLPFLLPGMHERYFFLADAMTLILAVHRPRLFFVPLLVQAGSLLAYQAYLMGRPMLPMTVAASLMLAAVIVVGYVLIRDEEDDLDAELDELTRRAATPAPLPARPV